MKTSDSVICSRPIHCRLGFINTPNDDGSPMVIMLVVLAGMVDKLVRTVGACCNYHPVAPVELKKGI